MKNNDLVQAIKRATAAIQCDNSRKGILLDRAFTEAKKAGFILKFKHGVAHVYDGNGKEITLQLYASAEDYEPIEAKSDKLAKAVKLIKKIEKQLELAKELLKAVIHAEENT